jgi:hypothetical protein
MNCENFSKNRKSCNCTYEPCSRKGHCCLCLQYHKEMNELPACFFSNELEQTYDRSLRLFLKTSK